MAQNSTSSSSGIGFTGALTILFIALKLTNVINWSWLWVLSPVWISVSFASVLLSVIGILHLIQLRKQRQLDELLKNSQVSGYSKKSKFMQKLEEAMKASEANKNDN